ncbi:hypothetical protein CB1_081988003 [Camelus ferus]|nr:hypothetical protein CB1_081988003 [Camelus ferus]
MEGSVTTLDYISGMERGKGSRTISGKETGLQKSANTARSSKDFEKSRVGFDFYLDVPFDDLELIHSLRKERTGHEGLGRGQADDLVVVLLSRVESFLS